MNVNIQHEKYGVEEGVKRICNVFDGWGKEGRRFYACDGWSEVKEKQWVEVPPSWPIGIMTGTAYRCDEGKHLKCVERYDLPEDIRKLWLEEVCRPGCSFWEWLKQFKKPYLAVEEHK